MVIDGYACMLDVLDTAGQEELSVRAQDLCPTFRVRAVLNWLDCCDGPNSLWQALRSQWIRSGEGFLLLYSITDKTSFDELEEFRTQILHVRRPHPPLPS